MERERVNREDEDSANPLGGNGGNYPKARSEADSRRWSEAPLPSELSEGRLQRAGPLSISVMASARGASGITGSLLTRLRGVAAILAANADRYYMNWLKKIGE